MTEVEDFIYSQEGSTRELLLMLHHLLVDEFGLQDKIRFRVPFYYGKTWICYLNPLKKAGLELAFIRGNELSNDQGLLDFKKRKQVAGISYTLPKDVDFDSIRLIVHEAILLDDTIPYTSNRKKK